MTPDEYRAHGALDEAAVEEYLRFYAQACAAEGVTPLIENVPPVLRMRTGGVYLTPVGGHWRDLRAWCERVEGLRVTFDTSHAALFAHFAAAYPSLFELASDAELSLERYVEELLELTDVAHVSDAHGLLGEGLPYGTGELDLDPVVRRLGEHGPLHRRRDQRARPGALAGHEGGLPGGRARARRAGPPSRAQPRARGCPSTRSTGRPCVGRRDPVPVGARAAGALRRPARADHGRRRLDRRAPRHAAARLPARARHAARRPRGVADRRPPRAHAPPQLEADRARARRHPRRRAAGRGRRARAARRDLPPRRLQARRLGGDASRRSSSTPTSRAAGTCCAPPRRPASSTVVVASTDKAALAASFYGRTKRFMEQLTAYAAGSSGGHRCAVRLVNVLASAGSASELFLRQARAGVPLTVTDTGMMRFWITGAHAALVLAHGALLAARGRGARHAARPGASCRSASWRSGSGARRAPATRPTSSCSASAAARR